ncbi:MAG: isochorismatase family cysteine hydrolase [Gemmatimonadota bacterium]
MTVICWDVDTQVDFIHHDGALAVPGAEAILPRLETLTAWARRTGAQIVATADDHDIGHAEITANPDWKTTFPPHCMRDTPGQRRVAATALVSPLILQPVPLPAAAVADAVVAHNGEVLLNKPGTDVFRWNPHAATVLSALRPTRIVVYGVATDVCVRAAVDGLARHAPGAELVIVADAVRAIDAAAGDALLEEWRKRGCRITTTAELTG